MVTLLTLSRRCLEERPNSGEYKVGSVPAKGDEEGPTLADDEGELC
jgi:hypothetical protein